MIRTAKKIAYDVLRERPKELKQKKHQAQRIIKVYITVDDQVGIKHMQRRVGKREKYEADVSGAALDLRKSLIRSYPLKKLKWSLWTRDSVDWACLPKLLPIIEDGSEFRLVIEAQTFSVFERGCGFPPLHLSLGTSFWQRAVESRPR
jgi:hypothetical protein